MVRAWSDIPDNPSWESADPKLFTTANGTLVSTGNSVILDHGNGEFSMIAHSSVECRELHAHSGSRFQRKRLRDSSDCLLHGRACPENLG